MITPTGWRRLRVGEKPAIYDMWYDDFFKVWRTILNLHSATRVEETSPPIIRKVGAQQQKKEEPK